MLAETGAWVSQAILEHSIGDTEFDDSVSVEIMKDVILTVLLCIDAISLQF